MVMMITIVLRIDHLCVLAIDNCADHDDDVGNDDEDGVCHDADDADDTAVVDDDDDDLCLIVIGNYWQLTSGARTRLTQLTSYNKQPTAS